MFKLKAGALIIACVFSLSVLLSGCKPVAAEAGAFGGVYAPEGMGLQLSENLSSDSSSDSSSEDSSESSSEESQPDPPAPAPVQPITQPVLEDPKFKPTEEDKKEDPQKGQNQGGNGMGNGGTLVVPDNPPDSSTSSGSEPSSSSEPSSAPSDSSSPDSSASGGSESSGSSGSSSPDSSGSSSSSDSSNSSSSPTPAPNPPRDGWYEANGKKYCYVNGKKLTGWQNVNNVGYWFNDNGELSSKKGIDVSKWNGKIDWAKVKADGIDFAIIRVGVRGCVSGKIVYDEWFVRNVKGATANGIEVGVYFFSQAINAEEGKQEAEWTLNAIRGYNITGPIVIDSESAYWDPAAGDTEPRGNRISREARTDSVVAFCNTVKAAGRKPMIYANQGWFEKQLDLSRLTGFEKWLARWAPSANWSQPFTMWQSCSDGKVNGISGNVDRNAWMITG